MLKKIFLISIILLIPFSIIFALEVDWPPSPLGTDLYDYSTLTNLIQYFYEWGIALGGLAAFIALLIAGFMYLTSVGDPQKMADARGRIVWALAGLVLLLASWLILNTINPDLTTLTSTIEFLGCDCAPTTIPCSDCAPSTPPYTCVGDSNPGDSKKEGICAGGSAASVEPPNPYCSYAVLWKDKDFKGASTTIDFDEEKYWPWASDSGSVKAFYDDSIYFPDKKCWNASTSEADCINVKEGGKSICHWNVSKLPKCFRDCGPTGCYCSLILYDEFLLICYDEITKIFPFSPMLVSIKEPYNIVGDGQVSCVELKKETPF